MGTRSRTALRLSCTFQIGFISPTVATRLMSIIHLLSLRLPYHELMARSYLACFLLLWISFPESHQDSPQDSSEDSPLQLLQSDKSYGPDGPWHAVSVAIGDPAQNVDLYPGGASYASAIFTNSICEDITQTPCGSGGLYDPSKSTSAVTGEVQFGEVDSSTTDGGWTNGALLYQYDNASYAQDNITLNNGGGPLVQDLDLYTFGSVSMKYPDGTAYPVQVGQLSLGNSDANQTFSTSPGEPAVNGTLVPSYLYAHHVIPSSSYGLHYGSAALGLDLSLWLGGYDISRVVGDVASQSYSNNVGNQFAITLLDIAIAVDNSSYSPFPYRVQSILAAKNTTLGDGVSIIINPAAPYLNLPASTCDAIATQLPVTYSTTYGLYLWNVNDDRYAKIVTSPTYLSFVFNTQNIDRLTINVPFQLLNLTLEPPLTTAPTQYFPCQPPQDPASQQYGLGRAFLQAAFFGVQWHSGSGQWYLAQAPGPKVSKTPDQTAITNSTITASKVLWADTWKDHWTPIPFPAAPLSTKPASHSGLSHGAVAGLVIGVVCGVLICLATAFFIRRRIKSSKGKAPAPPVEHVLQDDKKIDNTLELHEAPALYGTAQSEPVEMHHDSIVPPTSELAGSEQHDRSRLSSQTYESETRTYR